MKTEQPRSSVKIECGALDTYALKHLLDAVPAGMVCISASFTFAEVELDPEVPEEPAKPVSITDALLPASRSVSASPNYSKPEVHIPGCAGGKDGQRE